MSFSPFFLETQTKPHIINLQGTEKTPTTFPSHVHTHVHTHVHRRTTNTHEDVFFSPKRPKQTGAAECGCGPGCWWLMEADAWGGGRCGRTAPRPRAVNKVVRRKTTSEQTHRAVFIRGTSQTEIRRPAPALPPCCAKVVTAPRCSLN